MHPMSLHAALHVLLCAALLFPASEAGSLSASIALSSYVANATGVSLTISFRVASESASVPIKHVMIAYLPGSEQQTTQYFDNSSCICTNLQSTKADTQTTVDSPGYSGKGYGGELHHEAAINGIPALSFTVNLLPVFLGSESSPPDGYVITLSETATCAAPWFPVTCVLSFFGNCNRSTATAPVVNVSTLHDNKTVIDEQSDVKFPAFFSASLQAASVQISHNVAGVRATVSFSFMVSTRNFNSQFKTISISGLRFSSYDNASLVSCSPLTPASVYVANATYSSEIGVLLIVFSAPATPGSTNLTCTTDGFTNPKSFLPQQNPECSKYRSDLPSEFCIGTVPSGTFADTIPVHYMLDDRLGAFVWVAAKHAPTGSSPPASFQLLPLSHGGAIDGGVYYLSQSKVQQLASKSVDLYMREDASSVSAVMLDTTAHNFVRDNIAAGHPFFKGFKWRVSLTEKMKPSPESKNIPDPFLDCYQNEPGMFTETNLYEGIFHSCGNPDGAHTRLNSFWRMRDGKYDELKSNTVWFKVPVSFAPAVKISTLDDTSTGIDTTSDVTIPSSLEPAKFISAAARIPTTSNTLVSLFMISSRSSHVSSSSSRVRLGLTACCETTWVSESSVQCRAASGIEKSPSLIVSVFEVVVNSPTEQFNVSYNHAPVVKNISNIVKDMLVNGVRFGDYIAIVPHSSACKNVTTLAAQSSAALCSLDLTQSLGDITEAVFNLRLEDFKRLDDVSITVLNPKGVPFMLMQKKCYGCMEPPNSTSINISFNIPSGQSTKIPDVQCKTPSNFIPMSSVALAAAFESTDARGVWHLAVTAGSSSVTVFEVSMFFKTSVLTGFIGASKAISMSWTSDSAITMSAPGAFTDNDIISAAGAGRNHTVEVQGSSDSLQPSTVFYSYPDPVVSSVSAAAGLMSTGSAGVPLFGRSFSNSRPSIATRLHPTSSVSTIWTSDTCLRCAAPQTTGLSATIFVSIQSSAIASLVATFQNTSCAPSILATGAAIVSNLSCTPTSSSRHITIIGSKFGAFGWSLASRLMLRGSSASVSRWSSDSQLISRAPLMPEGAGANALVVTLALLPSVPFESPATFIPKTSVFAASEDKQMPTTGSVRSAMSGFSFGTSSMSLSVRWGKTSAEHTVWISDTLCITRGASKQLASPSNGVVAISVANTANATRRGFDYVAPPSGTLTANFTNSTLIISECFALFNSSASCSRGVLISSINGSRGFGTAETFLQLNVKQSLVTLNCDASSWVSDSSIHCMFTPKISIQNPLVFLGGLPADTSGFSNQLSLKNPFFIADPPLLNETFSCRMYSDKSSSIPSVSNLANFAAVGNASGFLWNSSKLTGAFDHSEAIPVVLFAFINAGQYYLDTMLVPVTTYVNAAISVLDSSSDVTKDVLCKPPDAISFNLPASNFIVSTTIQLRSCARKDYSNLRFLLSMSTRNANGAFELNETSSAFTLRGPSPAGLTIFNSIIGSAGKTFIAGSTTGDLFRFRYNFSGALNDQCETQEAGSFSYSIKLSCKPFGTDTFFRTRENITFAIQVDDCPVCVQTVSQIQFILASQSCVFNVSVPSRSVYVLSSNFTVVPGPAAFAKLLGTGPLCSSAGSQIYSMNVSASGGTSLCLVSQLLDAHSNNVSSPVSAAVVARNSLGTYRIARSNVSTSDSTGVVRWCDAFSSTASSNITIGIQILHAPSVSWFSTTLNISGVGPAGGLQPVNTSGSLGTTNLSPMAPPPKITFNLLDAGGNSLSSASGSIAIRVRVISARNASNATLPPGTGRRILQISDPSQCEGDLQTIVSVSNGSSSISAGPGRLCSAGVNEVIYDIGVIVNGVFVVTFSNVFSVSVTVLPGPMDSFMLTSTAINTTSYKLIDSLRVTFRDAGLNVVSGTATISIISTSATASLYPNMPFSVSCNVSTSPNAAVPAFFVTIRDWKLSEPVQTFDIRVGNSSIRVYGGAPIRLTLRSVCGRGTHVASAGNAVILNQLASNTAAIVCMPCNQTNVNSWHYDAASCLTLKWDTPPLVVISGKSLNISGIRAEDADRSAFTRTSSWRADVQLLRTSAPGSIAGACSCYFQNDSITLTTIASPIYIQAPASNYKWLLLLFADGIVAPVLNISYPLNNAGIFVLDFEPVIMSVLPSGLSCTGGDTLTVVGSFPNGVPANQFAQGAMRSIQNDACVFTPALSSRLSAITLPANRTSNAVNITFACGPFPPSLSGPASTTWTLFMSLSDGRASGPAALQSYCPLGYYVQLSASGGTCLQCPVGRGVVPKSTSLSHDSVGLQSCVCNKGFYGTFGDGCIACPNVKGFNCQSTNLSKPLVFPGFFIDYSLLNKCSEFAPNCDAIIECPNPDACLGSGEKMCMMTKEQCYSNESFGCTTCCPTFYIDNLKCLPCPPSQLPLLLGLATLALILFAVISSSFDFPPIISAVQSFKIIISALQSYVSIRLISIQWPDIVLRMFDFTRFFTFSFDVIRPECTVSYSPQTKLLFVLVGPLACAFFIAAMALGYAIFKGVRICTMLRKQAVASPYNALDWSIYRTLKSVCSCLIVSAFSTTFGKIRMLKDGALWHALDPTLALRSDITVVKQRLRRPAISVAKHSKSCSRSAYNSVVPDDWQEMSDHVRAVGIQDEFTRSAKRVRLLSASAFSIFIFIYQGCLETFFSSFDCSSINSVSFLRTNPTIQCNLQDTRYLNLVVISSVGVFVFCALLPLLTIFTLRSIWVSNMNMHSNMNYSQIFGFLTMQYSKRFPWWELISCIRKVVFVGIPVFVSRDPLVQSVALFAFLLVYTFSVVKLQPMSDKNLNQMEIVSCIGIIMGAFASIFFSVEYKGQLLLIGSSRNFVGSVFVIICAVSALSVMHLLYLSVAELLLMHKDISMLNWVVEVKLRLGDSCKNGIMVPLVCMFFNEVSSPDVLQRKLDLLQGIDSINRTAQLETNCVFCMCYSVSAWYQRLKLRIKMLAAKPTASSVGECVSQPEFDFLQWLLRLSERCKAWRKWGHKDMDVNELPLHFRDVQGASDPPLSSYARCVEVVDMLESVLPAEMYRTLTGLMFSILMDQESELEHAATGVAVPLPREFEDGLSGKNGYDQRIEVKLREFIWRMTKILAIYQRLQAVEKEERSRMPWFTRAWRHYQKPSALVLDQLSKLRAASVLDAIEDALGSALANKEQQKFQASLIQQQALTAKTGSASTNKIKTAFIPVTAGKASAVQSAATTVAKQLGLQQPQNNAPTIRSPPSKQRNSTVSASGLSSQDAADSRAATSSRQRQNAIELQEVVVHGAIGAAVDNQASGSTECSPTPSPPSSPSPDSLSLSPDLQLPSFFNHQPRSSTVMHVRAQLSNAASVTREAIMYTSSASGSPNDNRMSSPLNTMPSNSRSPSSAPSSQSPKSKVFDPNLLTAAARVASVRLSAKAMRPSTPSRMPPLQEAARPSTRS